MDPKSNNKPISSNIAKAINYTNSKYRNSKNVLLQRGLFLETANTKKTAIYTLKDYDYEGYPSLKRLFLETGDTTEYFFAKRYLDSYDHWLSISKANWFKPYITKWREELRALKEAAYLSQLEEIVALGGKDRTSALKTLLDRVKTGATAVKKGRPVHPYREEHEIAQERSKSRETLSDLKRLGLAE